MIIPACTSTNNKTISKTYLDYINNSDNIPTPSSYNKKRDAEYYFINGEKFEQQLLYPEAIIEYLEALRLDTNAVIYYALGRNYLKINKYNRAEEYFKKSINFDPSFTPALEKLGSLYIITYREDKAITTYEELVKIDPSRKNLEKLAQLYQFNDLKKAAEIYEKLRQDNNDYDLNLKLAYIYFNLKDTSRYIQRLEDAYKFKQNDYLLVTELIKSYLQTDKSKRAVEILEESNKRMLSEDFNNLLQSLGEFLIYSDDSLYTTFKEKFIKAIDSRFYFSWELQTYGGIVATQIGKTSIAERFYNNAMTYADSIPEISLQLANFYLSHGKYSKSINILNKHFNNFPDDYRFLDLLALAYFQMDSLKPAISYLQKSIWLNDENTDAMNQLGIIYDRLNVPDSSDYYYNKVLEIEPDNSLANNNYAYSLATRKKDLKKALEMSKISLNDEPDNASYLDTYGWILFQMGNYENALEYVKKAGQSENATGEVFQHLGDIYIKLKQKDNAINAWKKGLEIDPENQELLKRLNKFK